MTETKPEANDSPSPRSHLFTVRLWLEELGHGQIEWRGQVQHVLSGESRYFRDWPTLIAFQQEMLPGDERERGEDQPANDIA